MSGFLSFDVSGKRALFRFRLTIDSGAFRHIVDRRRHRNLSVRFVELADLQQYLVTRERQRHDLVERCFALVGQRVVAVSIMPAGPTATPRCDSGHRELAERTGARIYLGAGSGAQFPHIAVKDGDEVQFGQCRFRFLQTPGHTMESICIVMADAGQPERPQTVFTGDTLFIGDVGRPDLSATHTPQQLAAILYQSLHEKLLTLPDDTEIFPAHGAGSLCGRQMSSESSSTIGKQRTANYALLARTPEEFVHLLTDNLPSRPEYFAREVDLNRRGAAPLSELPPLAAFTAPEVVQLQKEGAVVVDTRPAMQFAVAHVPGSVHIALTGQYASWAARILGLDTRLIIVGEDPEHVRESQVRLARVGVENVAGYLAEGVAGWISHGLELGYIPQVTVQEFVELRQQDPDHIAVLDVREPGELSGGVIEKSVSIPLGELKSRTDELDRETADRQGLAGSDGKAHAGENVAAAALAGQIGGGKPHQ